MQNHASAPPPPPDANQPPPELPDLPPVELPSASFVAQLFLIPAAVVVVVIAVWLLFGKLAGGERDAMDYVQRIRSSAGSWRSAYELASLLQNDPKLTNDPRLLGELTDLLNEELDQSSDPRLAQYLAMALGTFQTLAATLADGRTIDPLDSLVRALDPKFDPLIQIAAATSLARQAARLDGGLDDARVVTALTRAATTGDDDLRQLATYALGFCGGEASTEALRDRLTSDGDRFVRYNAAVALARRGDPAAVATLGEMLSTADLERVVDLTNQDAKRSKIESIQLEALAALDAPGVSPLSPPLQAEIEALTRSEYAGVRSKALEILQKLQAAR